MGGVMGMARESILVVDDEVEIAELVEIYLKNDGYNVTIAVNGQEALAQLAVEPFDLVILDIMMPGIDGVEVCRRIRKEMHIPIIMLSAKSEDMDKILGLTTGADDYLTKPFNPLELMARVKSQLRRAAYYRQEQQDDQHSLRVGGLVIEPAARRVTVDDQEISLTPTEFDILNLLVTNKGMVFSSEKIFEMVWREKYFEGSNTVMVHIRKIREKIEKNPRKPEYIKTVWGVGYKVENT